MPELGSIVVKVRSKNAGPFWLTVDIFCGDAFDRVSRGLTTATFAARFRVEEARVRRFDLADLRVVKFSLPRPEIQGRPADRDMHGAGWGPLVAGIEID